MSEVWSLADSGVQFRFRHIDSHAHAWQQSNKASDWTIQSGPVVIAPTFLFFAFGIGKNSAIQRIHYAKHRSQTPERQEKHNNSSGYEFA